MMGRRATSAVTRSCVRAYSFHHSNPSWQPAPFSPRASRHRPRTEALWDRWVPDYASESRTLQHVMEERMATRPFKEAYHFMRAPTPLRWSNEDLKRHSEAVGVGLLDMGYKRSSKLATWAGNEKELPVLLMALGMTGNHMVAIDPDMAISGVKDVLGELGCRGMVFTPRWGPEQRNEMLTSVVDDLDDGSKHAGCSIQSRELRSLRHLINVKMQANHGVMTMAQVPVYNPSPSPLPEVRRLIRADWPLFTSVRKAESGWEAGKTLSTVDSLALGSAFAEATKLTADGTVLVVSPMHTALSMCGGFLGAMGVGAKAVLVRNTFDVTGTLETLTRQRVTTLMATSEQLAELEEALSADQASSDPKYSAPFLSVVVADESYAGKGSAPSTFAGASVIRAESSLDDGALA